MSVLHTLNKLRLAICDKAKRYWHYEGNDHLYVDFVLSVLVTNYWRDNPVWAIVIGPAGGGKTDLLMCMQGHDDVHMLGKLTPNALVSGWHGEDMSLLPLLDGKFLILKDFTTILQMDSRRRDEIIGQLRGAYDGQEGGGFGIGGAEGGMREYKSHFTLLAACTPAYEYYYSVNSQLGERFIIYRFRHIDPEKSARKALLNQACPSDDKIVLRKLFVKYLNTLRTAEIPKLSAIKIAPQDMEIVVSMASLVARSRTRVHRDGRFHDVQSEVVVETPTRLALQLAKLAKGCAVSRGRDHVTADDMCLVGRVAADSIPSIRMRVMQNIYGSIQQQLLQVGTLDKVRGIDLRALASSHAISRTAMTRTLEDMVLCGILTEKSGSQQAQGRAYSIADKYTKVLRKTSLWRTGATDTWIPKGKLK
jgi:hypothetical protein